ncbi:MAG: FAD-dependent oxidoreductase [Clostridium sp.]|nr:FAD-dependent oxidoreductase [Clostridium sp.]
MIEIHNLKVPVEYGKEHLEQQIMRKLHTGKVPEYRILKRSIDARKKPQLFYVYTVGILDDKNPSFLKNINNKDIMLTNEAVYQFPQPGSQKMKHHPLIVGAGPAGLFCALQLAKQGYIPIIAERGLPVEERISKVNDFWEHGRLDTECNVQFGEGGAGTFSDGKLNTQIKDSYGRIRYVLETFVRHGAPEEILYDSKPHVGTDLLVNVVKGIRKEIESYGGTFIFHAKASDIKVSDNRITEICLRHEGMDTWVACDQVVLAIGHSARDTVSMLYDRELSMEAKDFAMGVRIEHPAAQIQQAMYGDGRAAKLLPAAPYKLTHQTENGRGVYSFCMCPGGYVVNASSEEGMTAVNGMSYSGRDGANSNSAIIVTVRQSDFGLDHPLAGMELQRQLERNIFKEGHGKVVSQRFADFCENRPTKELGTILPQIKGGYVLGNVRKCLPDFMGEALCEGIYAFDEKIKGFANGDAVISGVESRTSSPVRIKRDDRYLSNIQGIYPCGEGAGYAGGILSAAIDGMKVAEAIMKEYAPKKNV